MDKRIYVIPSLRQLALQADGNFLTSGTGENADPQPGQWSAPYDDFDF